MKKPAKKKTMGKIPREVLEERARVKRELRTPEERHQELLDELIAIRQMVNNLEDVIFRKKDPFEEETHDDEEDCEEEKTPQYVEPVGYAICCFGNGCHYWYGGKGEQGKDLWADQLNFGDSEVLVYEDTIDCDEAFRRIGWFPDRGEIEYVALVEGEESETVAIHPGKSWDYVRREEATQSHKPAVKSAMKKKSKKRQKR